MPAEATVGVWSAPYSLYMRGSVEVTPTKAGFEVDRPLRNRLGNEKESQAHQEEADNREAPLLC